MQEKIAQLYQFIDNYIPSYLKNFYLIISVVFVVWMLFFDTNNIFIQISETQKYKELETEKAYYQEKITRVKEDMESLQNNKQLLEKFAREKYYFRKKDEDVYVVIEEEIQKEQED